MATLLFAAAGAVAGDVLGGSIGAIVGQMVGSTVGSVVDHALLGMVTGKRVYGPRLTAMRPLTSNEGAPIPKVYGRARLGGQLIWATRFLETTTRSGGKGGPKVTTYNYYGNFAVGLCEGPIAFIRRIWADGKEVDQTTLTFRVYRGSEDQAADPLIIAKEGADFAPAYRGLAYVVFEMLPLTDFGNRIPQLTFEVVRPVQGLANMIQAVNLIPGASEFVYAQGTIFDTAGDGVSTTANRHQFMASSDWAASIDALQALCPRLKNVALVTSWFGDDLRAGHCTIAPRVESADRAVSGGAWGVAGLDRSVARVVSQVNGMPAYGGTPSDDTISAAIIDLRLRGLNVTLYPFVMMDIAAGNALPDPWTGAASQPAFPWRGRITCAPAPGQPQSVDATAAAAVQVNSLFGSVAPLDNEWSFRRMVLHYAKLAKAAGGVDAFLIGSELASLTRVRSASGVYPAIAALQALATDVRAILGPSCKLGYGANWSEYGAHVLGGGELRFPLDPLWSSPSIDFVGIDAYWPLSDWRDGTGHADADLAASVYDRDYLISRFGAGEDYDFYYVSDADRANQIRTQISDVQAGKPWAYRAKDMVGWWSNPHFERVNGQELSQPTAWVAGSKPIWLTEFGCPAIDRGANQPNVFVDAKSSESAVPHFSRGNRDDLMQVRALEAGLTRFDAAQPGFQPSWNPVTSIYAGHMVDASRIYIWAWDARPYPAFPQFFDVWADAPNWYTGHWITGRLECAPLDRLVAQAISESGTVDSAFLPTTLPKIDGFLDGYVVDSSASLRGILQPLSGLFGFDGRVTSGKMDFSGRATGAVLTITPDDLVPAKDGTLVQTTRAQETELPHELSISFVDSEDDYQTGSVSSRRMQGYSRRVSHNETAAILPRASAQNLTDILLQELWAGREQASFSLGPHRMDVEIGDLLRLPVSGQTRIFRVKQITDANERAIVALSVEPAIYDRAIAQSAVSAKFKPKFPGPARVHVLDLAQTPDSPVILQRLAVFADPWPGTIAVYQASGSSAYSLVANVNRAAQVGNTTNDFGAGVVGRFDLANHLDVVMANGVLASIEDIELLNGQNMLALQGADGSWEILQFARADLIAPKTYRLSRLLRGQGGEEGLAARAVTAGAPVVVLDAAVVSLAEGVGKIGLSSTYRIGPANLDYSDPAYVSLTTTVTRKALEPYTPVALRARRQNDGVHLSFLRRGRLDSDAWEPVDIPLGEDNESYQAEIWSGNTLKRTLAASSTSILYAAADELADFGNPQAQLSVSLYQISAAVGRGFPLQTTVTIF